MKATKYTVPDDGGIRAIALHRSGALARLGSRQFLLDTSAKKPAPTFFDLPLVQGASPHLPPLAFEVRTAGFVGDQLVTLCAAIEQPGYPALPASVRCFDLEGRPTTHFDVPGAEWLWIDARERIIVHAEGRSSARETTGAVLADLGPSLAVPSPDGEHLARKVGEHVEISGASSHRIEGAHFAWIDASHLVVRSPMDTAELQRLDVRDGSITALAPAPKPSVGLFADARAVWVVVKGGTAQSKLVTVHRTPLDGGPTEQLEIPGGKSEARACLTNGRLAVAVLWQKAVFLVDA